MLMLTRLAGHADEGHADERCAGELRLAYEWRQKSRARLTVAGGKLAGSEVGLALPRGTVLRDGDVLANDDGATMLRVRAAAEQLLHVTAADPLTLLRIGYHLGNRHVPVQAGGDEGGPWLRLALDHVLENMVEGLGGVITVVGAPFDPEQGAYGAHAGHHPPRDHDHGEQHVHAVSGARHGDRRHAPRIHDFTGDDR